MTAPHLSALAAALDRHVEVAAAHDEHHAQVAAAAAAELAASSPAESPTTPGAPHDPRR